MNEYHSSIVELVAGPILHEKAVGGVETRTRVAAVAGTVLAVAGFPANA